MKTLAEICEELLDLWTTYTLQEMYGEHLRGMGADFDVWQHAHDRLRAALRDVRTEI